jgi:hypothetical protein
MHERGHTDTRGAKAEREKGGGVRAMSAKENRTLTCLLVMRRLNRVSSSFSALDLNNSLMALMEG